MTDVSTTCLFQSQSELYHLDDDYWTGCRNVRYSQQQSYWGLSTPGRSYSPELTPEFKSFSRKRDTYPIISLPPQSVQLLLLLGVSYVVEPIWPSITATINSKASSRVNVPNTMKATCLKKRKFKRTCDLTVIWGYVAHNGSTCSFLFGVRRVWAAKACSKEIESCSNLT